MSQYLINKKSDLIEAVKEITNHKRIAHDTETFGPKGIGGLFPFHGSRSFSHQIATENDEYYFDFNVGGINPKYKSLLQPIFTDKERLIFYVNAIFDGCISHFDGIEIKSRICDWASIARVEYNNHQKERGGDGSFLSMAYLSKHYGVQQKNDLVKEYIKENNLYGEERCRFTGKLIPLYELVPNEIIVPYGCDDVRTTFDGCIKTIKCINYKDTIYEPTRGDSPKMIEVAKNEIKLTSALLKMKIDGAKVWTGYVEEAIEHEQKLSDKYHAKVKELAGDINLNSGKQVADYLIGQGVEIPRKEPTPNDLAMGDKWLAKADEFKEKGKPDKAQNCIDKANAYFAGRYKTDKKTLAKVMEKHPDLDFLSMVTKAKQSDKKINTYYKNFLKLKDDNDIIHCSLNQEVAVTGRFSSSDPNFQNLHKEKWIDKNPDQFMIRKSIIPKHEDFNLFFFDYKGQEMYIMIDQSEDIEVIEDILKNDTDIYIAMGNLVYKVTGIEIDRSGAKALSLGVAYGQGKALIAKNLGTTEDKALESKKGFLAGLKGVKRLDARLKRQAETSGKIHNPYGRVSYIEDKRFAYKSLNSRIQGSAADCTKVAIVRLHDFLEPYRSHMILTVHDEIIFEIHKDEHFLVPDIKRIMSEAYPSKHLPLRVDVEWSQRSWGEKEDFIGNKTA